MNFHGPVQCSEDLAEQPPLFQTGVVVSDLQHDAEKREQPRPEGRRTQQATPPGAPAAGNAHCAPRPQDRIVLYGGAGETITMEGLGSVLEPGGAFQIGQENQLNVVHGSSQHRARKPIKNKYKLTDSTAEPVIRHLDVISAELAEDWFRFGLHLGLTETTLQQIRMDYSAEGQHEVNYRVLARWKQEFGPVSVRMLAMALVDVGRGDLADELRKG